ncbi:SCN4B protein, partial [Chloropsis hardwickii]|nr:SCN4B protein [Chloropsis hardwickii]
LPGLHIFAIAFALEVSVGKTNTVTALNNSNVLLPCTFSTCIGFQDLVFTWYFNSTELVGGSPGSASAFLAAPVVLPQCSSRSSRSPRAGCPSLRTDNTVTLIIVGVVGGLIGLLILFMLIKRVVLFIIKKTQDGKKECLVSSSGNDNTENGLAGSKAEQKAPPKA